MHRNESPTLRLRSEQFRRHCRLLGLETATAQADHLGLSKWTVTRLLNGGIVPGERVIARCLVGFPNLKFEDLFEVVEMADVKVRVA
jgi:hypothetical protein